MIISFRHKGLKKFYWYGVEKGIAPVHAAKLRIILAALGAATEPSDLAFPSFKLHPLQGTLKAHWSIWVDAHCRITFRFIGEDIELVDDQDYH